MEAYSALSESKVVNEPAPASRGKTKGTSVASFIGPVFLNISIEKLQMLRQRQTKQCQPEIASASYHRQKRTLTIMPQQLK